jgi:DNA-binding transcriptional LysR family regulator
MNENFDWGDIRIFLKIVELGTFGKAADELGLAQPTVSRRVAGLEKQIGKQLFKRTKQGVTLTSAGEDLHSIAQNMAVTASAIGRLSSDSGEALGKVKLRVPDVLAYCVLIPALDDFLDKHPQLSVEIDCGIVNTDDTSPSLFLQYIPPADELDMSRTPVGWVHFSYFGSPAYFRRHGTPKTLAEFASRRLVHHAAYNAHREKWNAKTEAVDLLVEEELLLVTDSGPLNLAAIEAGVGIGALPSVVVERGTLQPLALPVAASLPLNLWHQTGADDALEIQVCKDWLTELFSPKSSRWFQREFVDPSNYWDGTYTG